jgi:DNA-binding MarR family transcriptional regulator
MYPRPLILLVTAIGAALLPSLLAQPQQQQDIQIYEGISPDAQLIQLDRRALNEAYHEQVKTLWLVWLKGQAGDPIYFKNGLTNARRAYNIALTQISKRESEIMERELKR